MPEPKTDKIKLVQSKTDVVTGQLIETIKSTLANTDRIVVINDKAEHLAKTAQNFEAGAKKAKCQMLTNLIKTRCAMIMLIVFIIAIIIVVILVSCGKQCMGN